MNITVIGAGYVGMSNALLLAQKNNVSIIDLDHSKIQKIQNKESPIADELISKYLKKRDVKLEASTSFEDIQKGTDYIVICTPTNFDPKKNSFNTSSIDLTLKRIKSLNLKCGVVIRSTIPIGYTNSINKKYKNLDIAFFPEFLREGKALHDNLYPSRIICGSKSKKAKKFLNLLLESTLKKSVQSIITSPSEAESIKLFSNTYLAMRVAFFNELDSFALDNNLSTKAIIDGVCLDERIQNHYNNPSFGYGGYCLPKDTKQLKSSFNDLPNNLISSIIQSNKTRKKIITKTILDKNPKVVGCFRLVMKKGSDNWRESSIIDILKHLKKKKVDLLIYEPMIESLKFMGIEICKNLDEFKERSSLIITNRDSRHLSGIKQKVFTRDIFNSDT
jgi:UDPglucose 6-dehydrogenase